MEKIGFKNNELSVQIKNNNYFKKFVYEEPEYFDTDDETFVSFYIPCNFDIDDFLGTNVCSTDNDDYINLFILWGKNKVILVIDYWDSDSNLYSQEILLTDEQIKMLKSDFATIAQSMLEEDN